MNKQSSLIYQKHLKDIDFTKCDPESVRHTLKNEELIESTLYEFLKKNFSQHESYIPIINLFNEVTLKTAIGKSYEEIFNKDNDKPNLDMFTMQNYKTLVRYKTVLNSFVLPVSLAMFLAGKFDPELHRQARTVLTEVGNFHRVRVSIDFTQVFWNPFSYLFFLQRDFLNVFGSAAENKECAATDIRNGECSWLAVVTLQRCNPEQKKLMKENYGKSSDEAVNAVKQLYEDLGLPRTYETFEEESFKIARAHAHQISKGLPHTLFFQMVEKIYRREIDFTPH